MSRKRRLPAINYNMDNSKPEFTLPTCQIFYLTKSILKSFENGDSIALRSLDSPLGSYSLNEYYDDSEQEGNEKKFALGFLEDDVYRSTVVEYVVDGGMKKKVKLASLIKDGYCGTSASEVVVKMEGGLKMEDGGFDGYCIDDDNDFDDEDYDDDDDDDDDDRDDENDDESRGDGKKERDEAESEWRKDLSMDDERTEGKSDLSLKACRIGETTKVVSILKEAPEDSTLSICGLCNQEATNKEDSQRLTEKGVETILETARLKEDSPPACRVGGRIHKRCRAMYICKLDNFLRRKAIDALPPSPPIICPFCDAEIAKGETKSKILSQSVLANVIEDFELSGKLFVGIVGQKVHAKCIRKFLPDEETQNAQKRKLPSKRKQFDPRSCCILCGHDLNVTGGFLIQKQII